MLPVPAPPTCFGFSRAAWRMYAKHGEPPSEWAAAETQELAWLAAYKARPPSAGNKERSLPWEPGKLELWLERQPLLEKVQRSASCPRRAKGPREKPSSRPTSRAGGARPRQIRPAWSGTERRLEPEKPKPKSKPRRRSADGPGREGSQPHVGWSAERLDEPILETEGIWWEWQWWGSSGWSFFSSWVTEQIEKAFALGKPSCKLLYEGRPLEFDLATGQEVNGPGRIRRIRMPSEGAAGAIPRASVCSTFLASEEWPGPSMWTSARGESNLLSQEEGASCLLEPSKQSLIVHGGSLHGFSSDWFADMSSRAHKPGRHESRVRHRAPLEAAPSVVLKGLPAADVATESPAGAAHWRYEAYAALSRAGMLEDSLTEQ
ncbi:unnamed protein product [Effrenium voratum]|nr:unnamed protein product [Effrenium voratum]